MADLCPTPSPGDPLIQSLLASTDCHVQAMVRVGYDAISLDGGFSHLLTALMTLFVAVFGYQLLLGRANLSVSNAASAVVKLGAMLALATQWPLYERIVYGLLFHGPEQLADLALGGQTGLGRGGIAGALQHAVDDLTLFSPAAPPGPVHRDPNAAASLPVVSLQGMTPAAGDALLLMVSALLLLLTTLGALITGKVVLGVLLALGPLFVALFLFDTTRGVFMGWLRASLAAAMLPMFATGAIVVALTLLAPLLTQLEVMDQTDTYTPGVAIRVFVIVLVVMLATLGLAAAAGVVAFAIRLPAGGVKPGSEGEGAVANAPAGSSSTLDRADRVAAALSKLDRVRGSADGSASSSRQAPMIDRSTGPNVHDRRRP